MVFGSIGKIVGGMGQRKSGDIARQTGQALKAVADAGIEDYELALTRGQEIYDPYVSAGGDSLEALVSALIGGDTSGFENTPGYQYAMDEAMKAVDRGASARGGVVSGRTLKELQRTASGMASQNYQDYVGNLMGLMGEVSPFVERSVNLPLQGALDVADLGFAGEGYLGEGRLANVQNKTQGNMNIIGGAGDLFKSVSGLF